MQILRYSHRNQQFPRCRFSFRLNELNEIPTQNQEKSLPLPEKPHILALLGIPLAFFCPESDRFLDPQFGRPMNAAAQRQAGLWQTGDVTKNENSAAANRIGRSDWGNTFRSPHPLAPYSRPPSRIRAQPLALRGVRRPLINRWCGARRHPADTSRACTLTFALKPVVNTLAAESGRPRAAFWQIDLISWASRKSFDCTHLSAIITGPVASRRQAGLDAVLRQIQRSLHL